jgi:hypothetical protein
MQQSQEQKPSVVGGGCMGAFFGCSAAVIGTFVWLTNAFSGIEGGGDGAAVGAQLLTCCTPILAVIGGSLGFMIGAWVQRRFV